MKTTLVIDRGNTTLKASVFKADGDCAHQCRIAPDDDIAGRLRQIAAAWHPVASIYSSVVSESDAPLALLKELTGREPIVFSHATPLPLAIGYTTPQTLGLDRIAAATGALSLMDNGTCSRCDFLLVADAGTALTIDVVRAAGIFVGGNISAGLTMRLHALHHYAGALPEVSPKGPVMTFGTDTESAIRSGAFNGIVAEITKAFADARAIYGRGFTVLTGGDAPMLAPHLPDSPILRPDLVASGLNRILHYNEVI